MKYIKIPLTEQMDNDYKECIEMDKNGEEKSCSECSCNGGTFCECLGAYQWCEE